MQLYLARWVLPVASPPIPSGVVAVHDGRIAAVGRRKEVQKAVGAGAEIQDLGDVVVFPGLVNAHTHLELSWMGARPGPKGDFVAWIRDLIAQRETGWDPTIARTAAESAASFLEARGTVAVGDVGNGTWIASVLARTSLRAVAFHEVYGFRVADAEQILEKAAERLEKIELDPDVRAARERLGVVLTPHAPHTLSPALLKALAGRAAASNEPLSIHVAESEPECELIRNGRGPMAGLLRERGAWDETFHAAGHSPVEHLDRLGVLSSRTLAVHCVHLDHQDISKLQARGVTVVTCPRSNAWLGVGTAPVPRILASGIPVALGTDSLASAPDLDLFAEMAALREQHPGLAPAAVLRMATLGGARALGFGRDLGSFEAGKRALLLAVPLEDPEDDPLEVVTQRPDEVRAIYG